MKISTDESNVLAFGEKDTIRVKIIVNNKIIEQILLFLEMPRKRLCLNFIM
jgi:hypothetical protein